MAVLASDGSTASSMLVLHVGHALLTAFVFWVFQRRFGIRMLSYWMYGWMSLAGQLAGVATFDVLAARLPATSLSLTALAAVTLAFGYLAAVWLVLGAFAVADRREPPARLTRTAGGGAIVAAIASCIPYATADGGAAARFLARAGTLGAATGLIQLAAGLVLWRRTIGRAEYRRAASRGPALGLRLVATAFVALGALTFIGIGRAVTTPSRVELAPILPPPGEARLLLSFTLGLGLVIWLLETEQRRTLEAAQRAEHMAYHDALTGLPNRLLLIDRLRVLVAHARRTRQPFAVFFLDVDHFKTVNDTYGHAAGDRLLQQVGARLTAQLREADTVARLGGDEFVVLTPDLTNGADVTAVGEKLLEAVRAPMLLDDREVCVTVSIGVSVFPDDGDDADALLRRSDSALYLAKEEGRDSVRLA